MNISKNSQPRFRATIDDSFRNGERGTYETGCSLYTTYYDTVDIQGDLDYSTGEGGQLENLNLSFAKYKPVMNFDEFYVKKAGIQRTGMGSFKNEDIARTRFNGKKFRVDFLPGREAKSMVFNTKTGKVKFKRGFFTRSWTTTARVDRAENV